MIFDSGNSGGLTLMQWLEKLTGNKLKKRQLLLPDHLGKGSIKAYDLGSIRMTVHQFELKEEVTVKRAAAKTGKNEITFSFRNVLRETLKAKKSTVAKERNARLLPSVQVSSADVALEIHVPAKTNINTIVITAHADLLKDLMNKKAANTLLQHIVSGNQPYLYDEIISPEIQDVAASIATADVPGQLTDFFLKLKAEEMIYLFFTELLKREHTATYPLNGSDVKMMYIIRDKLVADLSIPPDLGALTSFSNMSESKMNRLFKQIFGNSIYNYYQVLRMNEAAYLIKEQKLSISETGYRMGFTNLSHFTRIFERHIGIKPKKYSLK